MTDDEFWELERKLWLDAAEIFERAMDNACVMAFAGMGIMQADAVRESLRLAPRWDAVGMTSRTIGRSGDGAAVLGYHAEAKRAGSEPYACLCTSTYRRSGTRWLLIQHQQTPE